MASISNENHNYEEYLLDTLNDLDIGFVKVSDDGIILNHNLAFNKIFGYPEKNLIGTKTLDYWLNSEERNKFRKAFYKDGVVKKYIAPAKNVDGKKIFLELNTKLNKNPNGEVISSERTFVDITERIRTEQQLKESEEKYRLITENANDLIAILNRKFEFEYINEDIHMKLMGYSKEDAIGKSMLEILHPDDLKSAVKSVKEIITTGEGSVEVRVRHSAGHWVWMHVRGKTFVDNKGEKQVLIISRDITERKKAEQKLKGSEEKYRSLFDNMLDGFAYCKIILDHDNNPVDFFFLEVNDAFERLTGLKKEETIGKRVTEVIPGIENSKPNLFEIYGKVALIGEDTKFEIFFEPLKIWLSISVYSPEKGYFVAIFNNITERKIAEEKLKQSEERFKNLYNNAQVAMFSVTFDGEPLAINDFGLSMLDYSSREEFFSRFNSFNHWANPEERRKMMEELKQKGEIHNFQTQSLTTKGVKFWSEFSIKLYPEKGQLDAVAIDVTDRKEAELKLKESQDRFRRIIENAPFGYYRVGKDGLWQFVNPVWEKMHGYSLQEIIGKSFEITQPENAKEQARIYVQRVLSGEAMTGEFGRTKKDGTVEYHTFNIQPIYQKGEIIAIEGFINDITELKETEQRLRVSESNLRKLNNELELIIEERTKELKESEEILRSTLESTADGILVVGEKGQVTHTNSKFADMWRIPQDLIDIRDDQKLLDYVLNQLKDPEAFLSKVEQLYRSASEDFDTLYFKDGRIFERFSSSLIREGEINGRVWSFRDITERKKVEEVLYHERDLIRTLLENLPDFIYFKDKKGRFQHISKSFCEFFGRSMEEIIGKSDLELFPEEVAKRTHSEDLQVIKTGIPLINKEESGILSSTWVLTTKIPWFDKDGNTKGLLGISHDITERKKAEQKLKESEENLKIINKAFLKFTEDPIINLQILVDTAGTLLNADCAMYNTIISSNSKESLKTLAIYQEPPEFIKESYAIGHICTDVIKDNRDEIIIIRDLDKTKYAISDENVKKYNLKQYVGIGIRLNGISIASFCLVYTKNRILSESDIELFKILTKSASIEVSRLEAMKKIKELSKIKSEFLRRASHELKTPLISIKGFSELILTLYEDQLDTPIISKLREINDGCERLQNIINNLLKTSRLESPELKPKLQKEDLSFLIQFCVHELKSLAEKRNQSIKLEIHSKLYANIEKEEIHDVLSNLITNAIKYTPPMGKIEIKTELKEDSVVVSVKDNGIGFTEDQKKKIFKQFGKIERYGQGLDLGIDGTGLGLYISKRIVESHGGKIWMESEGKNKGASFYFTLPIV